MKKIFAILPCYNEEDNIGPLIDDWNKQLVMLKNKNYDLNIVVINDCSTDNTKNKVLEKQKQYSNIILIEHEENKQLRGGLNTALEYFNKNGTQEDLLVLMDGDNTHNPKYVSKMIDLILDGNDCVIASRYKKDSSIVGLSKNRELMSDFAKIYYSMILKIPNVKDYTCGYRMYTYNIIKKLLEKYGENPIKEKSFACMMELLYKVYVVGGKFEEIGFELRYDKKCGNSKMKVLKTAERSLITAIKLKFFNNKSSIIYLIILILFAFFLSLGTNYSPIHRNVLSHDCGIFSYVAFAMQKGRILYKEVWENKGPLLYFIYYIGLFINERYGIYILELLSIFISVLYAYKTIKVITNNDIYSLLGIIYTFSIWVLCFEVGTFSESFALPIIFVGIYLFTIKILKDKKIKNIEIIFWGILTALIATLRLNMLATFLAFFIVIGINLLIKRDFKEIFRFLLYGILGFIIGITPMLIYLIKNNALLDCMNTAYFGILDGFNSGTFTHKIKVLYDMIKTFNYCGASIFMLVFMIISIILILTKKIKNKQCKLYLLGANLAIIINLYANSVAGAYQMHYFITFIPIVNIVVCFYLKLYENIKLKYNYKLIIIAIIVFAISFKGYNLYIKCIIEENKITNRYLFSDIINEFIENNTNSDDLVQLIGGRMESVGANFATRRLSASKYSYLPLWNTFTKERKAVMVNELVVDLYENIPKLIFICEDNNSEFYDLIEDKTLWDKFIQEYYIENSKDIPIYRVYIRK